MNSNNHPGAYGYQPRAAGNYYSPNYQPHYQPKPPVPEDTISAGFVEIERKTFAIALKDNPRGRFLRITEKNGMRHATIIVPATGLKEFQKVLADMIQAEAELPKKEPEQPV
jgi:hypothetical protein